MDYQIIHLPKEQWQALQRQREKEAEEVRRKLAEEKANSFDPYRMTEQPPKVQQYLNRMRELCRQMHNPENTLMDYLYHIESEENVNWVFNRYQLGSTKRREVIYWQIDRHQRVRVGKIMDYNPDGHRKKEKNANWVHRQDFVKLETKEQLAPQCLFGEHLIGEFIANPSHFGENTTIALVEAEKTALICSLLCPDTLWLATGSAYGFTRERLEEVKSIDVVVYPDADTFDKWEEEIKVLNREGFHLIIPDTYRAMCTPEARKKKYDLVDFYLNGKVDVETLRKMQKNFLQ